MYAYTFCVYNIDRVHIYKLNDQIRKTLSANVFHTIEMHIENICLCVALGDPIVMYIWSITLE